MRSRPSIPPPPPREGETKRPEEEQVPQSSRGTPGSSVRAATLSMLRNAAARQRQAPAHTPLATYRGGPTPGEQRLLMSFRGSLASSTKGTRKKSAEITQGKTPHILSTQSVADLPWNRQPSPPDERGVKEAWSSLTSWFSDGLADTLNDQQKKKKKKRKPRKIASDMRPAWNAVVERSPLTGQAGPQEIAFLRKPLKPWERMEAARSISERTESDQKDGTRRTFKLPAGRQQLSKERRIEMREADMMNRIEAFASEAAVMMHQAGSDMQQPLGNYICGDANRRPPQEGWIQSQAWLESLRYYGNARDGLMQRRPWDTAHDSSAALSGHTHTIMNAPDEHLETEVRARAGICDADPEWRAGQVHQVWAPKMVRPDMKERLDKTVERLRSTNRAPLVLSRPIAGYPNMHLSGSSKRPWKVDVQVRV
jgi:hypothetical protein